ncbi:FadR family transcriptional regulator [Rhodococcus sp. CX]|nr:FadR family transcriptional regulator [Rhodococcus sp. CX]
MSLISSSDWCNQSNRKAINNYSGCHRRASTDLCRVVREDDHMPFEIKRVPIHDQVRDHLLDLIRSGSFPRNSALPPERELAATLGVSRHSLRQALASLETVGLIEARHGSGVYLTERPSDEAVVRVSDVLLAPDRSLVDVLEARLAIEPFIAATAAERRTDDDIADIRAGTEQDERTTEGITRAAIDFHQWLVGTTRNPVLQGIMRSLTTGEHGIAELLAKEPGEAGHWHVHHEELIDAVVAGNADLARRLMTEHIEEILAIARTDVGSEEGRTQ